MGYNHIKLKERLVPVKAIMYYNSYKRIILKQQLENMLGQCLGKVRG